MADFMVKTRWVIIIKLVLNYVVKINPTLNQYTETAKFLHHLIKDFTKVGIVKADSLIEMGGKGLLISDMAGIYYELAR